MPTYQYRCPACGHQFEKFEKITATGRSKCPDCGGRAERVISGGAGLLFKGSGFYITDYQRSGSRADRSEQPGKSEPSQRSHQSDQAEGRKPSKPDTR